MRLIWKLGTAAGALFVLAQLVRPTIPTKPAAAEIRTSPEAEHILNRSCYSCHSDERRLSWFDQIEPSYFIARHDILDARARLNFSTLGSAPQAQQRAKLFEAVNMIQLGAMPLPQFVALHPDAKVSSEELAQLKAYLAPWGTLPRLADGLARVDTGNAGTAPVSLSGVRPEPNGLNFDPSFESWKLLSTTDRGDNNTFRFILGNDVAVKAVQAGNISPWPDGTRFAKVAWQQELGEDGLIRPGKFVQVELMVKDARHYKDTDGWGWGRWLGASLKPYGDNAHFVQECTGCHLPVRGNDYVYTLPISGQRVNRAELVNNAAAALPTGLPSQSLGWQPITMFVDPKVRTMGVLFGNDIARTAVNARSNRSGSQAMRYRAGAVLALVTWSQREDPHWFGGRIPNTPQSIEFVTVGGEPGEITYRAFSGNNPTEVEIDSGIAATREKFLLGLSPVRMP